MNSGLAAASAVCIAALLDWLLGDPRWLLHPVQVIGWLIRRWQQWVEAWAGDQPWKLRTGGFAITLLLVTGSGLVGWSIEQLTRTESNLSVIGWVVLVLAMASALAARSLHDSVLAVIKALPATPSDDLKLARERLSWIVGRDVSQLNEAEILRAAVESASENAVDGLFAPLFWMGVGSVLWSVDPSMPGPLALAWMFKAASTLDSMLGYRSGRLRWLGTAGARLDDLLTWVPCRLVMLTLPLISQPWTQWLDVIRSAERDGAADPSPNAGRSEAIYAHCIGIKLGGSNRYGDRWVTKPLLAETCPDPDAGSARKVLSATVRLEIVWLIGLILAASAQ